MECHLVYPPYHKIVVANADKTFSNECVEKYFHVNKDFMRYEVDLY